MQNSLLGIAESGIAGVFQEFVVRKLTPHLPRRPTNPGAASDSKSAAAGYDKQLNLSDAQQQQIKSILENKAKQMQTLHQDSSLSQQGRMNKTMQIRQDTSSQIEPILNADQQQKYEQMMSRQGRGRGPGGPDQMSPAGQGQDQPPPQ